MSARADGFHDVPFHALRVEEAGGGQGAHAYWNSSVPQAERRRTSPKRYCLRGKAQAACSDVMLTAPALASRREIVGRRHEPWRRGHERLLATHWLPVEASVRCGGDPRGPARAVRLGRDSRAGRREGSRRAVRPRVGTPRATRPHVHGTRGDTRHAQRRSQDHEVPHKGRAS
jgi:hypothetical protein